MSEVKARSALEIKLRLHEWSSRAFGVDELYQDCETLLKENDRLVKETNELKAALNHPTSERMGNLIRERDQLVKENEKLKFVLKDTVATETGLIAKHKEELDQLRKELINQENSVVLSFEKYDQLVKERDVNDSLFKEWEELLGEMPGVRIREIIKERDELRATLKHDVDKIESGYMKDRDTIIALATAMTHYIDAAKSFMAEKDYITASGRLTEALIVWSKILKREERDMSEIKDSPAECPKCASTDIFVERRVNGDAICRACDWHGSYFDCFKKSLDELAEKERQWFKSRGYSEADMMYADAAFKEYLRIENELLDKKPFDKAPGFRRIFMMGYFYGRPK